MMPGLERYVDDEDPWANYWFTPTRVVKRVKISLTSPTGPQGKEYKPGRVSTLVGLCAL